MSNVIKELDTFYIGSVVILICVVYTFIFTWYIHRNEINLEYSFLEQFNWINLRFLYNLHRGLHKQISCTQSPSYTHVKHIYPESLVPTCTTDTLFALHACHIHTLCLTHIHFQCSWLTHTHTHTCKTHVPLVMCFHAFITYAPHCILQHHMKQTWSSFHPLLTKYIMILHYKTDEYIS